MRLYFPEHEVILIYKEIKRIDFFVKAWFRVKIDLQNHQIILITLTLILKLFFYDKAL